MQIMIYFVNPKNNYLSVKLPCVFVEMKNRMPFLRFFKDYRLFHVDFKGQNDKSDGQTGGATKWLKINNYTVLRSLKVKKLK